jgi:type I restriction enzyme R subunit
MAFVDSVSAKGDIDDEWRTFVAARRTEELDKIIEEEGLQPTETKEFIESAFRDGSVPTTGTAISRILPPVSRFAYDGVRGAMKDRVLTKLMAFLERFSGLSDNMSDM